MARVLLALAFLFTLTSLAADEATPTPVIHLEEIPKSAEQVDCAAFLTVVKAMNFKGDQRLRYRAETARYRRQTRDLRRSQGAVARQTYADGNRIFEQMLSMIASGRDAGDIADFIADDVNPVFDAVRSLSELAIKTKKEDGTTRDLDKNEEESFVNHSKELGEGFSRYAMIVETLVSIVNQKGAGNVGTVRKIDKSQLKDAVTVYDLRSETAVKTAAAVLKYLDRENSDKGLAPLPSNADDPAYYPFPSLQVAKEIFKANDYAKLANAMWDYNRQNRESNKLVWAAYILADAGVNLTNQVPNAIRPLVRTLTGLGNTHSVSARYGPDLQKKAAILRGFDANGNMVVTYDPNLLDLLTKEIFGDLADGGSGNLDLLVTFGRYVLYEDVWSALMDHIARKANATLTPTWGKNGVDYAVSFSKPDDKHPTTASRIWADRLEEMMKAEAEVKRLGKISWSRPKPVMVVSRAAIVQTAEAGGVWVSAHYTNFWPTLFHGFAHPIMTVQDTFHAIMGMIQ